MTTITIRRPSGTTETVELPQDIVSLPARRKIAADTKAAGRGEILSWNVTPSQAPKLHRLPSVRHCCAQWSADQGCPLHGDAN